MVNQFLAPDKKHEKDILLSFINLLNDKMVDIKKSGNTKVYIEMFLLKFINDNVKLSKFILAVIFVTCGIGVSVHGITLFNLSLGFPVL